MESRGNQGASGFVVDCKCTESAGRSEKVQISFAEDSEGKDRSGIRVRTWQQCRVLAKNIVSNHRKTMISSKMYAERIESFLLFYTLRCFDR